MKDPASIPVRELFIFVGRGERPDLLSNRARCKSHKIDHFHLVSTAPKYEWGFGEEEVMGGVGRPTSLASSSLASVAGSLHLLLSKCFN